jgi:3-oxoacyl-[acyl-carrier protein] reductase
MIVIEDYFSVRNREGGSMDLKQANVLVTGGSSGIGRAIAEDLSRAGARVAITGRHEGRLREVAAAMGALAVRADVTLETDVERTYGEVLDAFGHIDVLVNNAGIGRFANLVDMDRETFESVFRTNVTGAMLMGRAAARHFVERGRGNIVNIGSTAALRGAPGGSAYYASKFALRGMTECWRGELRPHNVRVFLINPSEVITRFAAGAGLAQRDNPTKLHPGDVAGMVRAVLEMDDRGFTPELTLFATNPKD